MARDNDNDDRPKKSWREIDQQRDGSQHRKGPKSGGAPGRGENSQAYRSYKSQLNKLFDGGGLPDLVRAKLGDTGVADDAARKKTLVDGLLAAAKPADLLTRLAEFRAVYSFPENEEVLAKLLDLTDEAILLETIKTIAALKADSRLKRPNMFKARLKTVEMMAETPAVQEAARSLSRQL